MPTVDDGQRTNQGVILQHGNKNCIEMVMEGLVANTMERYSELPKPDVEIAVKDANRRILC